MCPREFRGQQQRGCWLPALPPLHPVTVEPASAVASPTLCDHAIRDSCGLACGSAVVRSRAPKSSRGVVVLGPLHTCWETAGRWPNLLAPHLFGILAPPGQPQWMPAGGHLVGPLRAPLACRRPGPAWWLSAPPGCTVKTGTGSSSGAGQRPPWWAACQPAGFSAGKPASGCPGPASWNHPCGR